MVIGDSNVKLKHIYNKWQTICFTRAHSVDVYELLNGTKSYYDKCMYD